MKKIISYTICILILLIAFPQQTYATKIISGVYTKTHVLSKSEIAENLIIRLNEINAIDKSGMKTKEKKALRNEVMEINNALTLMGNENSNSGGNNGGGVYLSAGAIIIIILLLIILL